MVPLGQYHVLGFETVMTTFRGPVRRAGKSFRDQVAFVARAPTLRSPSGNCSRSASASVVCYATSASILGPS